MSIRSTKANVSKLLSQAARSAGVNKTEVFGVIAPIQEKLTTAMQAKCCDIYNVVVGPYANNSWTVYFGFNTSEHFITFDIESVFADQDKWIEQITGAAMLKCEITLERMKEPEANPIEDAMSSDFDTAKARIRRLKRTDGREMDVADAERTLRKMRQSSFDLDDVIAAGPSKENLAAFTHLFPKTCQAALAHVVN